MEFFALIGIVVTILLVLAGISGAIWLAGDYAETRLVLKGHAAHIEQLYRDTSQLQQCSHRHEEDSK